MPEEQYISAEEQYAMQEGLQRKAAEQQMNVYAPQLAEQLDQTRAAVIAETNPARILEEIQLKLEGKIRDSEGNVKVITKPVMNQLGISRIVFLMSSIINDNTRLTRLREQEIYKIMLLVVNDITLDLGINWREYGIKDRTMCDFIIDSCIIPSLAVLKRAEDQNEKNWLKGITVENITAASAPMKQKREGFLSKFKLG